MSHRRGFTLVELLMGIVIAAVLIALLTPAIARGSRQSKVEACAANLKAMHQAHSIATAWPSVAAPELGKAYWERLLKASPPLLQPKTLICPLADPETAPDLQYYGPNVDPKAMTTDDPIGCDLESNHSDHGREGGNILLRSGSVVNDNNHLDVGLWGGALRRWCRP